MPWYYIIGIMLTLSGLLTTIVIFTITRTQKRFDDVHAELNEHRCEINALKTDTKLVVSNVDHLANLQRTGQEAVLREMEEIKKMVGEIVGKMDLWAKQWHEIALNLAKHIAASTGRER